MKKGFVFLFILIFITGCNLFIETRDDSELPLIPQFSTISSRSLHVTAGYAYKAMFSPLLLGFSENQHRYQIGQTFTETIFGVEATISTRLIGTDIEYTIDLGESNGLITILFNRNTKKFTYEETLIIYIDDEPVNGYIIVFENLSGNVESDYSTCNGEMVLSFFKEDPEDSGDYIEFNGIEGDIKTILNNDVAISNFLTFYQDDDADTSGIPTMTVSDFTVTNMNSKYTALKAIEEDTRSYGYGPYLTIHDKSSDVFIFDNYEPDHSRIDEFYRYHDCNLLDYYTGGSTTNPLISEWFDSFWESSHIP